MTPTDLSSHLLTQLLGRASQDAALRERLLADPRATLQAEGVVLDARMALKVVVDTPTAIHLVVPAQQTDISDDDLGAVAGGRPHPRTHAPGTGRNTHGRTM